jgi:hypothetical protein
VITAEHACWAPLAGLILRRHQLQFSDLRRRNVSDAADNAGDHRVLTAGVGPRVTQPSPCQQVVTERRFCRSN